MDRHYKLFTGMLLVSLATLGLQILQVRIFSVMLWHHLAYMVISVTLLGFGAAGTYVAIKGAGDDAAALRKAGWAALLAGVSTVFGFAIVTRIPLDTFMNQSIIQFSFIFLYYAFLIVPYFFFGLAITLLLTRFTDIVHKLYFWNLLGSAIGGGLVIVTLVLIGGERAVFAIAALATVSAGLFFKEKKLILLTMFAAFLMIFAMPFADSILTIRPAGSKALGMFQNTDPDLKTESVEWDPIARIDVVSSPRLSKLYKYHNAKVRKIFTIDGDAYTFVYDIDGPYDEKKLLGDTIYASGYLLTDKPKVAIIGLGGWTDIITALHFNAEKITAVEINQAMINAAENTFKDFEYNPKDDERVHIIHEEGRSFLRRTEETYDVIQMSGVDTWSALASGAYVLSENYLYTKEAFNEYFDHLTKDGRLTMIRWIFNPPRECLRLVHSQSEVLAERGHKMPQNMMYVLQHGLLAAVVTSMRPYTKGEIAAIRREVDTMPEVNLIYAPGVKKQNAFARYFEARKIGKAEAFIDNYPFKIDAVSDDRPFFFEFYKWSDLFRPAKGEEGGYASAASPIGYIILLASLIQAALMSLLFILLPLWKFKNTGMKTPNASRMIAYFAGLGLGFMFIEVALMQKFVLFLGHPTYSITVTLFALLVASGVGSYLAGRMKSSPKQIIKRAALGVAGIVFLYAIILSPIFNALLGLPFFARVIAAIIVLTPLGLLMGMPFPTGLAFVKQGRERFVPWAFGINGVASVTGSVLCILFALAFGFSAVLVIAILLYVMAAFAMDKVEF